MNAADRFGQDWTDEELDLIVTDYFAMLASELRNETYNKSEFRRSLVKATGRTDGSIERKHQNLSAVFVELGLPTIAGYKPLVNFQKSILDAVERHLIQNPSDLSYNPPSPGFHKAPELFVESPPSLRPATTKQVELERLIRKFDPVERDFRNRALGKAGEEIVLNFECSQLSLRGRSDLAKQVKWVSQEIGDGAGYDIHSYNVDGSERLIEVKTTVGLETTPFYLTRNELSFSRERPTEFRICRLYDFSRKPRMFELSPPLDKLVRLEPLTFSASFD
ncbi:DUF3883 domain-containing protein [Afipia sp. Root123D2]|uniref:DUF3883 domain-containing protein n=1 Tax=Afipia sp. Root123D2 TaxID=1736436 RepID=UPI0009EB7957|nr:DUF3883 domain-containing protein [Afipia sp. Root123D2]